MPELAQSLMSCGCSLECAIDVCVDLWQQPSAIENPELKQRYLSTQAIEEIYVLLVDGGNDV